MLKIITGISLLFVTLVAVEEFTITPAGKVQVRYQAKSKEYTSLGELVHARESISFNDYIFGGTFGVSSSVKGYILNALVYGVARLHPKDAEYLKNEKSFYDNNMNEFAYLGEFNLKKSFGNHTFVLGRQTYKSSLVNDNYRITKNAYEGVRYDYKNEKFSLQTLYFKKIASSTLANNVPFNHKYGFIGYGLGYDTGGFRDVSKHLINKKVQTNGVLHFTLKYGDADSYLSYENLFADNFFNTSNLSLAYRIDNFYLKLGALYQTSIGKKHIQNTIDKKLKSNHFNAHFKYQKEKFKLEYMIAHTPYKKNTIYNGTLYSPFSNNSSLLRGLQTAHAIIADTTSHKIAITDLLKVYKVPLIVSTAYIQYDIGENNGLSPMAIDTSEIYLHLKGYFSKHLSAKIQYSYVKNFDPLSEKTHTLYTVLEYKF